MTLAPNVLPRCPPTPEVPVTEGETSAAVDREEAVEPAAKEDGDAPVAVGELRRDGGAYR